MPQARDVSEREFCSDEHRLRYQSANRLRRSESALSLGVPDLAADSHQVVNKVPERETDPGPTAIALPAVLFEKSVPALGATRPAQLYSLSETWALGAEEAASAGVDAVAVEAPSARLCLPAVLLTPGNSVLALTPGAVFRHRVSVNWRRMPRVLKVSAAATPVVLIAVLQGWISTPALARAGTGVQSLVKTQWDGIGVHLQHRASVALAEDFRSGLGQWRSRSNLTPAWSFDKAGFIHPGALALFRPTLELTDYRLTFLTQIDRQGFGFVFRAKDFNNYYAVRFVISEPGPLPRVNIVRYAVIKGREGPHASRTLALAAPRRETWYSVTLDVRKTDFTLNVQDNVADDWSDGRLAVGGVGFFCGKGEQARLRAVAVSHQNDTLGKVCAYLKPRAGAQK